MNENETFLSETSNQITKLWLEIGYTTQEIKYQKRDIEEELLNVLHSHLLKVQQEKIEIEEKISRLTESYHNLQMAVGQKPTEEKFISQSSLRQRHNSILSQYLGLKNQFKDKIQSFQVIQTEIENQFNILGIPAELRGEFAEVGDKDLSDARYYRFKDKNEELAQEIEERTAKMTDFSKHINTLLIELDEKILKEIDDLFLADSITDSSIEKVERYIDSLNAEKANRMRELASVAEEMIFLWQILDISKSEQEKFFATHKTLSISNIESSKDELKRLQLQRIQQLPRIIQRQQTEIKELCARLHAEPAVDVFVNINVVSDKETVFNEYAQEISHLKAVLASASSFLDLIEQRESMVAELNSISSHSQKSKNIEPHMKVKDENDLRRIRNLLPRLEKKLKLALLAYKGEHGEDFMWEERPYISNLDHIILSDLEMNRALRSSRKDAKKSRKSTIPSAEPILTENPKKARCKTDVYNMAPKNLIKLK